MTDPRSPKRKPRALLGIGTDPKTSKGAPLGYLTGIQYLAPADRSGYEVCQFRSPECTELCLNTSGHGQFDKTQEARARKTVFFFEERENWKADIRHNIRALIRKAEREGKLPTVRLNGTSDLPWERIDPELFEEFPTVQFYDYTKVPGRSIPANYHLTFSRSENNETAALTELRNGRNVAVVFATKKGEPLPTTWTADGETFEVIDGDEHDLRFLDPVAAVGYVIGLRAKGPAKKVAALTGSGFVLPVLQSVPACAARSAA